MIVLTPEERNVAENLKRLFEGQELSLREFAKVSGVNYRTIHAVIHGDRSPRIGIVAKMARAFGVKIDDLLKGTPAKARGQRSVA